MNNPVHPGLVWSRTGFSLLELLLSVALASLLVLGLVHIVSAASAAGRLQRNQSLLQEHARLALGVLSQAIRQAGFRPEPWNEAFGPAALTGENQNDATSSGDRLAVRAWSDLNCFDNRNPDLDSAGHSRFYIRESVFDLTGDRSLARLCRYGPTTAELTTQVPRQGLLSGVESFQVLFGEDSDHDGHVDRWIRAGEWSDPQRVLGIRVGLLLASEDAVTEPLARPIEVLDVTTTTAADGKLRRVLDFAVAMRGRIR